MSESKGKTKDGLDKSNKYDRQIRLWGDHGQSALESARVCLINATATGTEILKNLILPGIGSFTIVDGNKVQDEDAGNNFFLTKESIGKSRAKITTEYLGELNRDVNGDYVEEHPENLLKTNDKFFKQFSVVIATNLCERTLLQLGECLWNYNIPLLVCRSYGMIGYMRLVLKEHTVIESHPDSVHEDLRLDCPFPDLVKYADSLDLDKMNKKDHSHTPWLIVLYKYLQIWKEQHNGNPPKNYREKNQLKDLIKTGIRQKEEGGIEEEENFDEAVKAVNTALVPTRIPSGVQALFDDPECINLNSNSSNFWIMIHSLKDFVENEGKGNLPLRGTIPDMTADSERYIQLQNCYRHQSELDAEIVSRRVHELQQSIGQGEPLVQASPSKWSPSSLTEVPKEHLTNSQMTKDSSNLIASADTISKLIQGDVITEHDIKSFCKNAAFLRLIRCKSLENEYNNTSEKLKDIAHHLDDEDPDDVVYYALLRAVDRFYDKHNTYPGWYTDQVEADVIKLKTCLNKMLHDWGLSSVIKDDFVHEMCRYGAAELHSVAAFMGGTAAQEVIKLITHQFVPFNNTYIYNAMKQTSVTFQV